MPIRRDEDTIYLEGVCAVEDAEVLLQQLQSGATAIDWSGCLHLHAACFQVLTAARLPLRGIPENSEIARWLAPLLHPIAMPSVQAVEAEPILELET